MVLCRTGYQQPTHVRIADLFIIKKDNLVVCEPFSMHPSWRDSNQKTLKMKLKHCCESDSAGLRIKLLN